MGAVGDVRRLDKILSSLVVVEREWESSRGGAAFVPFPLFLAGQSLTHCRPKAGGFSSYRHKSLPDLGMLISTPGREFTRVCFQPLAGCAREAAPGEAPSVGLAQGAALSQATEKP